MASLSPRSLAAAVLLFLLAALAAPAWAASRIHSFQIVDEAAVKAAHGTGAYRTPQWLVVRRGLEVPMRVTLDSPLDPSQSFSLQATPFTIFTLSSIKLNPMGGNTYDVIATVDLRAPVGLTSIVLRLSDRPQAAATLNRLLIVVFNAWHPGDMAHFPDPDLLQEYVNNEHGITYRGSTRAVQSVRWFYGQFNLEAMQTALYILNKMPENDRKDPGLVARFVTAMSTEQTAHPDGILVGSWAQSFPNGQNPSSWQGSDSILRQYVAQGFRPVRYGQCWVFGAIVQTLMRALGVATRQVSNFDSAHEKPDIPDVYTQELARLWERNSRRMINEKYSIWNFHSWNEVYLQSPSSPHPYNLPEWHVVDGTPQEHSQGKFQLGPANQKAVFDMRKIPHDTSFVMSEVSGRNRNYLVDCGFGGCAIVQDLGFEPHITTGSLLLTKAVGQGNFNQESITHQYHNRVPNPNRPPSNNGPRTFSAAGDSDGWLTAGNATALPLPPALEHAPEIAIYHYADSGVSMSINIPPVRAGEPLVAFVNFACKARTPDFDKNLRATNRATRHVTLSGANGTDAAAGAECPETVLISFRMELKFASYAGQDLDTIGDVEANVVLRKDNGHFKSFRFVSHDYVSKASELPLPEYVRASVFATDHSTVPHRDILFFGAHSSHFAPTKIELYANRTSIYTPHASAAARPANVPGSTVSPAASALASPSVSNDALVVEADISEDGVVAARIPGSDAAVRVDIRFVNPLAVELTEATLTLSADHLGFEERTIRVANVPAHSTFLYIHEFSARGAEAGKHYYHAVLNTRELPPIVGEVVFEVNGHLF